MSDVIVSTTASTTNVTTTNNVTTVAVTDTTIQVSASTVGLQGPPGSNTDPTYVFVRNATGATLSKGSIVYTSGGNGTHTQVSLAIATADETSARVLGWLAEDIANNASGLCMIEGYLDGVNTQGVTEGSQLYLSGTVAGSYQTSKPQAPVHLVYVGVCVKASAGNGRVFVKVQNGYEIDELHNVQIISVANKDLLQYDSVSRLWKNVASTSITPGTATYAVTAGTATYATTSGTSVYATSSGSALVAGSALAFSGSITKDRISDLSAATVTSASTAQQSGTAVYAVTSGTSVYATTSNSATTSASAVNANYAVTSGTSVSISGSITKSQVSDFTSGTVTQATNASTATYSVTSGTAVYATSALTASTATALSGTITKSQVSDFTSGTVAQATNASTATYSVTAGTSVYATSALTASTASSLSGSITSSQVSDLANATVANISGTASQATTAQTAIRIAGYGGSLVFPYTTDSSGTIGWSSFTTLARTNISNTFTASDIQTPVIVQNTSATATADLFQARTNTGTALATIDVAGRGNFPQVSVGSTANLGYAQLSVNTGGTANKGLVVQGVASQVSNPLEILTSTGSTAAYIAPTGTFSNTGNGLFGTTTSLGRITSVVATNTVVGLVVRGAASQSADLTQWQASSGSTAAQVSSTGAFTMPQASIVNSIGTASVPLTVKGIASQNVDLTQWQNSGGTVIGLFGATGRFGATTLTTLNQRVLGAEANAGGYLQLTRGTATLTNPGANIGALYFRTGTNANTLKLVVIAGTAGAETTILDNIPT